MNPPFDWPSGTLAVPLIIAIVEALKRGLGISPNYAAILALAIGLALALASSAVTADPTGSAERWLQAVIQGLTLGLSASGLYSAAHAVTRSADQGAGGPGIATGTTARSSESPADSRRELATEKRSTE